MVIGAGRTSADIDMIGLRTVTIVRWSGKGRLEDLATSVSNLLEERGLKPEIEEIGKSVVVAGGNAVVFAGLLQHMPGTSWIAVGFPVHSTVTLKEGVSKLAKNYLKRGSSFTVLAEVAAGNGLASDLAGAANFAILDAVRGVKIDESDPEVVFRVAYDGGRGAVGVQLKSGPGGIPSGKESATCFVSGGMHSSVVAWMALLMGYSVELVHASIDEESVRSVARLYAELSHRVDPSKLRLRVLDGGNARGSLAEWARKRKGALFGGFHRGCGEVPASLSRIVSPLYIMPDEDYNRTYSGLSLKKYESTQDWKYQGKEFVSCRTFGGRRADTSAVMDGLK